MNDKKIIECKNAAIGYDGNAVVDDVSFDVYSGDYICIVGENGSGKSTLLKGLLGLMGLKSGEIKLCGLKRTDIGYLPQQTNEQRDFPATVREVVLSGCLNSQRRLPFYTKADKRLADENIKRLGIDNIEKKSYRELSGGQQQRVLLARALCSAKRLLLLDEPVTGLDPVVTAEFYKLIKKLNEDTGLTVIMVSHDIACAVKSADKILHMGERGTEFFGSTQDYLKSAAGMRFAKEDGGDA